MRLTFLLVSLGAGGSGQAEPFNPYCTPTSELQSALERKAGFAHMMPVWAPDLHLPLPSLRGWAQELDDLEKVLPLLQTVESHLVTRNVSAGLGSSILVLHPRAWELRNLEEKITQILRAHQCVRKGIYALTAGGLAASLLPRVRHPENELPYVFVLSVSSLVYFTCRKGTPNGGWMNWKLTERGRSEALALIRMYQTGVKGRIAKLRNLGKR